MQVPSNASPITDIGDIELDHQTAAPSKLQEIVWLQISAIVYNIVVVVYMVALCLAFYNYERFGGDPQKRGLLNQVTVDRATISLAFI